jgi:DNA modification methylase
VTVNILIGDVREQLRTLPDESVQCVVTSPPYWGLRDYGVTGQLGLEPTLGEHIATMVEVFHDVQRVLRKDGTLWLNYGDCYASSANGRSAADTKAAGNDDRTFRDKPFSTVGPIYDPAGGARGGGVRGSNKGHASGISNGRVVAGGYLKPKDLCGVPWRIALALQDDGWWLRQDIIWAKPNPMPESIKDRCTKSHEYLFLLAKSDRYYFDADAIREPAGYDPGNTKFPDGWDTGKGAHGSIHRMGREKGKKCGPNSRVFVDRVPHPRNGNKEGAVAGATPVEGATRNKRSVWTVSTEAFSEAHFATFPTALIEPCILAGCPTGGTVLDPFGGSGTTGLVADRLQRNAILIELNPEYAAMARRRIEGDAPLFFEAAE